MENDEHGDEQLSDAERSEILTSMPSKVRGPYELKSFALIAPIVAAACETWLIVLPSLTALLPTGTLHSTLSEFVATEKLTAEQQILHAFVLLFSITAICVLSHSTNKTYANYEKKYMDRLRKRKLLSHVKHVGRSR